MSWGLIMLISWHRVDGLREGDVWRGTTLRERMSRVSNLKCDTELSICKCHSLCNIWHIRSLVSCFCNLVLLSIFRFCYLTTQCQKLHKLIRDSSTLQTAYLAKFWVFDSFNSDYTALDLRANMNALTKSNCFTGENCLCCLESLLAHLQHFHPLSTPHSSSHQPSPWGGLRQWLWGVGWVYTSTLDRGGTFNDNKTL